MRVELISEPQHGSLIDLLCELHTFYNKGSAVSREVVSQHLLEKLLAVGSPQRLVVAISENGTVLGMAAITLVYSLVDFAPEDCRQCQLKELYVRASHRSHGVGHALMAWVARYALDNGCGRVDWPVKASNARGISFYESLGARRVVDRLSYRLSEPNMAQLAFPPGETRPLGG